MLKYYLIYRDKRGAQWTHEAPSLRWWEAMRFIEHGLGCKVLYLIRCRVKQLTTEAA